MDKISNSIDQANALDASRYLVMQLLVKLGNSTPTEAQIKLANKLLLRTTINTEITFHQTLTNREVCCLFLAARGNTMEEVAEMLNVKYSTVETWYKKIKHKLSCRSIAQAVFEGIRHGDIKEYTEPVPLDF
jgi:DNA-binding CsgD family transcriptional regulator